MGIKEQRKKVQRALAIMVEDQPSHVALHQLGLVQETLDQIRISLAKEGTHSASTQETQTAPAGPTAGARPQQQAKAATAQGSTQLRHADDEGFAEDGICSPSDGPAT